MWLQKSSNLLFPITITKIVDGAWRKDFVFGILFYAWTNFGFAGIIKKVGKPSREVEVFPVLQ